MPIHSYAKMHAQRSDACRKSPQRRAADQWCLAYQRAHPGDHLTKHIRAAIIRETGCDSTQARDAWTYAQFTLRPAPPLSEMHR